MMIPAYEARFKKDYRLAKSRGLDMSKIDAVITDLITGKPLRIQNRDHPLKGSYADCRECHIEPDWLLIYKIYGQYITFIRTGTHSDLF